MKIEVFDDVDSVARPAAAAIPAEARIAVAPNGRFALAISGGYTPWIILRALAEQDVPWVGVHVLQVIPRSRSPNLGSCNSYCGTAAE